MTTAVWLPTDLPPGQLETFVRDPQYVLEEKFDGVRMVAGTDRGVVITTNRRGEPITAPAPIRSALARQLPAGTIVDGERLHGPFGYVIFDLLVVAGEDLRPRPGQERRAALERLPLTPPLRLARQAVTLEDKLALAQEIADRDGEGLIFKDREAPYGQGRPAGGGPWTMRRLKFRKRCDVILIRRPGNPRRAFEMFVTAPGEDILNIGSVSARTFYDAIPELTAAVGEVEYLYASPTHRLVQPVLQRLRPDKAPAECTLDQLVIGGRFHPCT